jgi:HYR domain
MGTGRTRVTLMVAAGLAVLLVCGGLAASAVDNGVTADFNPADPNGENQFYTSPVTISFSGAEGDTCDGAITYQGPAGNPVQVQGTCTPADPSAPPYTGTFPFKYDDGAPMLDEHADIVRPAGHDFSIVVDYSKPNATDNLDNSLSVDCDPAPGATLPIGLHTVNCSAKDAAGNTGSNSFKIRVDGEPTVNVPADRTEEATSHAGANVSFSVSANDAEDNPDPVVTCTPSSPHTFPLGTTTVKCEATDSAGNTARAEFKVTVRDTTAPEFDVPGTVELEGNAVGGYQGSAYETPTTSDLVDGAGLANCAPGPGAHFDLGDNPVTCSAADKAGNSAESKSFTVSIVDTKPPMFGVVPQDVRVRAQSASGTPASNTCIEEFLSAPTATDVVSGSLRVRNDGPSRYDLGRTEVTFWAVDERGLRVTDKATVTVAFGPQGPCTIDANAPRNVRRVSAREKNRLVVLRWRNPRANDFSHVEIKRIRTDGLGGTKFFTRRREVLRDRRVKNGVEYQYVLYSVDEAGNSPNGVLRLATPHRILLLRPRDGAVISRPPLFDWVTKARARFYNLQLERFRNGHWRKVLSRWPTASSFKLTKTWRFQGRRYRLTRGWYAWHVWPAFGTRRDPDYGALMGSNVFRVKRR